MTRPDRRNPTTLKGEWPGIRSLLENTLGLVAGLCIAVLTVITCIDVVGRYIFDKPLTGAFELTEVLMIALVFSALPLTTERQEHVDVDLLTASLSAKPRRWLGIFVGLFSAALLATFAWRLTSHAIKLLEDGAVTNALGIPLAPFGFLAAFTCLVSAAVVLLRAFPGGGCQSTSEERSTR